MTNTQDQENEAISPQDHDHGAASRHDETPHVHESVKDIDELIAAMDNIEEGMPEKDSDDSGEEADEKATKKKVRVKEEAIPVVLDSPEVKAAKDRLAQIKAKVLTLRWDMEHGQINPAKKALYEKLRPEYDALVKTIEAAGQNA